MAVRFAGCLIENAKNKSCAKSVTEDLGLDLLDQVELVMNLEDEYAVEISDEDIVKLRTVSDILSLSEKTNAGQ